MPLRWSLEIWLDRNYKYTAPPVLPRGDHNAFL
jgi:hypothetical protein